MRESCRIMSQNEKEIRYNLYRGGLFRELRSYVITRSKEEMKEKSLKGSVASIIIFLILLFGLLIGQGIIESDFYRIIISFLIFVCFCVFVVSVFSLIENIRFNKTLCKLPYSFDYAAELLVYKNIGKTKKERVVKKLKGNFTIPDLYTQWEEDIKERNQDVLNEKNNKNFYHYLKRCLRNAKKYYDIMVAVLIPIEVGIMPFIITNNGGQNGCVITTSIIAVTLVFMFAVELYKSRMESEFVLDVIDILCPEYKEGKNTE